MSHPCRGAVAAVVVLALPVGDAIAATWIVDASGGGDAATIQGGMALASAGDTVLVEPGTYPGFIAAKSGVALVGRQGPEVTTVSGGPCLYTPWDSRDVLIQGLTFTGSQCFAYGYDAALWLDGRTEMRECVVEGNVSSAGTITGSGSLRIVGTRFARNDWGCSDIGPPLLSFWGELRIEDCTFEGMSSFAYLATAEPLTVTGSVFREMGASSFFVSTSSLSIENNLFERTAGWLAFGTTDVVIRGNTFVQGGPAMKPRPGWVIEGNLSTGGDTGFHFPGGPDPGAVFRCNNSWGHAHNWSGFDDPTGVDGNFSEPPRYCGALTGDYRLASNSACLPANNSCGIRVGAFGEGCGPLGIEARTWGRIKAEWRGAPGVR